MLIGEQVSNVVLFIVPKHKSATTALVIHIHDSRHRRLEVVSLPDNRRYREDSPHNDHCGIPGLDQSHAPVSFWISLKSLYAAKVVVTNQTPIAKNIRVGLLS